MLNNHDLVKVTEGHSNWKSAQVVNSHLVCDPTIRQPGSDLPRQQWSLLNRFRTEQGHCSACRRKWRLTDTDLCPCGETQMMSHIVWAVHTGRSSCWTTAPSFRQPPSTRCSTVLAWYVRPSHLRCRWTNDMELVSKQFAWAGHANCCFRRTLKTCFSISTRHIEHIRGTFCDDALYKLTFTFTLSNLVPWQNWMAAYLGYTLRMKTLFYGWPVMVHDTHTRKRRSYR